MDFNDYLGKDIPQLGFGMMRLPRVGDMGSPIDIEQTKEMVDLFLEAGFTYFDTARGYEGSEAAIKEALVDRHPRDSFYLASKLPAWRAQTKEEAESMFYTSLETTGAGYFDFFLLHNLGGARTKFFDDWDIWGFLADRKAEGLIKHLGFSMHDKADALDKILTEHPELEFVQLQINYADWESNSVQSRKNYETAMKHNKPVVIMEPVKGGSLFNLPEKAGAVLAEANPDVTPASWALRFAASLPGLVTVLSGMSATEHMKDNLATFLDFKPFTDEDHAVIGKVIDEFNAMPLVPCTACEYCVDSCQQDIAIPGIFETMNEYTLYGDLQSKKFHYQMATSHAGKAYASACVECGTCEEACPQSIGIIEELKKAAALLE